MRSTGRKPTTRVTGVVNFTATLKPEQVSELRELSNQTGKTVSEHTRLAIDVYLLSKREEDESDHSRDTGLGLSGRRSNGEDSGQSLPDHGSEPTAVDRVPPGRDGQVPAAGGGDLPGTCEGARALQPHSVGGLWHPQSFRFTEGKQESQLKITFTTAIRPDQAKRLKSISNEYRIPIAEHVRRALDAYFSTATVLDDDTELDDDWDDKDYDHELDDDD